MSKPVAAVAVMMMVATILLMQISTRALQRDFEKPVFQPIAKQERRTRRSS
jgi:hypothetical protein